MAGEPWLDYQKLQPAAEAGPWTDYAKPAVPAEPSGLETLWSGLGDVAGASTVAQTVRGMAEGVMGKGVPEGDASEFEGGRGGFAGRALGAGVRNVGEVLWEGIKAPGKMATGEMTMPEGEAAARGIALGAAGMGGWRPGMTLPAHQAAGPVAAGPRPATVQPGQGPPMLLDQPGPLARPATVQPAAGPTELTTAAPGSAVPAPLSTPRAPGTVTAAAEPVRNPRVDAVTIDLYRRSVLPRGGGRGNIGQVTGYEGEVLRGVDKLVENRPNLTLKTPQGVELPAGTAPRTMRQFDDAIDQTKTALFEKWNPMAAQAGEAGLRIDLAPVSAELRALAQKPEVALSNPGVVSQLENFATLYEGQGLVTPLEAQNTIKNINARLTSFYDKGEAASGAPAMVLEPVARLLRKQLDEGIEATVGPGWQELRRDYGALSAIERDVTKAVERIAKAAPTTGIGKLADFVASMEFIHAIGTLNPQALARAVGAKTAGELHRFFNNPNRMVAKLFDKRIAGPSPGLGHQLDPLLGPAFREEAIDMGYEQSRPRSGGFPSLPRTSVGGP